MDSSVRSLNALLVFLVLCVVGLAALEMTLEASAVCGAGVAYQVKTTPTPDVARYTPTPNVARYTPTPEPPARLTPTPEG